MLVLAGRIDQLHSIDRLLNGGVGVRRMHKVCFDLCRERQRPSCLVQGGKNAIHF